MAAASAAGRPHGMLSVIGLGDDALEPLCAAAVARAPPDTVCQIANLLFPTGRVVSGHKDSLAEVRGTYLVDGSGTASAGASVHHCQNDEPLHAKLLDIMPLRVSPGLPVHAFQERLSCKCSCSF